LITSVCALSICSFTEPSRPRDGIVKTCRYVLPNTEVFAALLTYVKYVGWWQPFCAWFGLGTMIFTVSCYGYATFLPGWWDVGTFFSYYTMCFVCPILYVGWKVWWKTKVIKPEDAGMCFRHTISCLFGPVILTLIALDLVWERPVIDRYEASVVEQHIGFWEEVMIMMGFKKKKTEYAA
jgi:amino acid transporter